MRKVYEILSFAIFRCVFVLFSIPRVICLKLSSNLAMCDSIRSGLNRIVSVDFSQITSTLSRVKCYCLSDLHADSEKNQVWVRENCRREAEDKDVFTVFLLPGDVGSEVDRLERVFKTLTENYDAVVYVPGNHEAWRRGIAAGGSATRPEERAENRMAEDSVVKLREVVECARNCGVHVGPLRIELQGSADGAAAAESKSEIKRGDSASSSIIDSNDSSKGVVIFPLYSWYHSGWDKEPELQHPGYLAVEEVMPFARKWGDFSMCSWPEDLVSQEEFASTTVDSTKLARAFADVNEPFLDPVSKSSTDSVSISSSSSSASTGSKEKPSLSVGDDTSAGASAVAGAGVMTTINARPRIHRSPIVQKGDTVVSLSHFLPRQELCPEKRFLLEPLLTKVVGSDILEEQVRRLMPHLHLFGHTHIPMDLDIEGIRYLQWPLGYSREADKQCAPVHRVGPLMVFDSALGWGSDGIPTDIPSKQTIWTSYYESNPRRPNNVHDLAPWVLNRLEGFSGFVLSSRKRTAASNGDNGHADGHSDGHADRHSEDESDDEHHREEIDVAEAVRSIPQADTKTGADVQSAVFMQKPVTSSDMQIPATGQSQAQSQIQSQSPGGTVGPGPM
jgi:hypothetical protein